MNSLKFHLYEKVFILPWLVWLSGFSTKLQTKGLLVRFPIRENAWVAGPQYGAHERQQHIDVSLPLFLPPFPSLKINKSFLKKCWFSLHRWGIILLVIGLWVDWGGGISFNTLNNWPHSLLAFMTSTKNFAISLILSPFHIWFLLFDFFVILSLFSGFL